jgi:acetyl esterase/lipase
VYLTLQGWLAWAGLAWALALPGCPHGSGHVDEYMTFSANNAAHARPVAPAERIREFQRVLEATAPHPPDLAGRDLREEITDRLNLAFLLDRVDALSVETRVVHTAERDGVREERIVLVDPHVGHLHALLLAPALPGGPRPAILGLHGHDQDQETFARDHLGHDLARAGFVVLVPTLRVMDCRTAENRTALHLVRSGFWLMGLRLYESLLMLDHLRHRPDVDPARVGLLGHSGGSSVSALLVRLTDRIAAQVTDYQTDYRDTCGRAKPFTWAGVHCETIPPLFALSPLIHDEKTLGFPRLVVPYGFSSQEDRARVTAFLVTNLRPAAVP